MSTPLDEILVKYVGDGNDEYKDKLQAAGLIVVDENGKTLYSKSMGRQTLSSAAGTFSHDSVCWIASMTKLATAVCCMQVIERGLIGLDDDVSTVVPQLASIQVLTGFDEAGKPILEDKKSPLTLRTLLTHSSGFCYDRWDATIMQYYAAIGKERGQGWKALEDYIYPLKFQPGEAWEYGVGIDWAGHVVEKLSGQTLEQYMQANIFQPLGMASTTLMLQEHPDFDSRRAEVPHRNKETGTLVAGPDLAETDRKVMGGGGGLFSTTADYSKLLASLVSPHCTLLSADSVNTLLSPAISDAGREAFQTVTSKMHNELYPGESTVPKVSHALGGAVNVEDIEGKRRAGSCRWGGMTNCHWWIDRKSGVAAVVMAQTLPPADPVVVKMYNDVETAVYKDLVKQ